MAAVTPQARRLRSRQARVRWACREWCTDRGYATEIQIKIPFEPQRPCLSVSTEEAGRLGLTEVVPEPEIGQQLSTTLGGTRVWRCSIARRLEGVGRGALPEVHEDRAQPRAANGW